MAWLLAVLYVGMLLTISRLTSHRATNDTFFTGERRSPWWAVAFGMLGASMSGVTFVSVPGMVRDTAMTYLQMCLGFVPGYIAVALVLLPVYYRIGRPTIYAYLGERFGDSAYRTGATFFLISKFAGAAVRLFLVVAIMQSLLFERMGMPFGMTAALTLVLMWLYTRRGGIRTLVWTDCAQTVVILAALVAIVCAVVSAEGWSLAEAWHAVASSHMSRVFVFDDWTSPRHFVKLFLSGAFIVVVMTGLDQDMMQKNLTCRTLRQAQVNMICNGLLYLPVNMLFLGLGVLLYTFAQHHAIALPPEADGLMPTLIGNGHLGEWAFVCLVLGVTASALSSADSALTALTTSVCVDILGRVGNEVMRRWVHIVVALLLFALVLAFHAAGTGSVIDAVYVVASYTYGPLLGLFGLGLCSSHTRPRSWAFPVVCFAAPIVCYVLNVATTALWDYRFGYELLLVNGALTAAGLWLTGQKPK